MSPLHSSRPPGAESPMGTIETEKDATSLFPTIDWRRIARTVLTSRAIDEVEENSLYRQGKVPYQFSSRGHELGQAILGSLLKGPRDGISAYYRSRPLLLTLGVSVADVFSADMARSGGYSDGRDVGVVSNRPGRTGPTVLPMAGDVGSQFTPAAGWAQSIEYRDRVLHETGYSESIAVVLGGDGAVATNGFWSCLTIATTLDLPLLFFIEDNGYAISVPGSKQTPGSNIARNLQSFSNLKVLDGDGTDPVEAEVLIAEAVNSVREERSPALIRLTVPRLSGHSGQDTQAYKPPELLSAERERDPLSQVRKHLVPELLSESEWEALRESAARDVESGLEEALARPEPDPERATRYVFEETRSDGTPEIQVQGGLAPEGHRFPDSSETPVPEETRVNMLTAIRRTLQYELRSNQKLLIFGEDVGLKGGVHAATMGLQREFGDERVFDTSLSEEGIIGRAVGMAAAGLMPVAEIQFRKYADPATEHLNNCGTMRWRSANRFATPIVVRLPGGFFKCGDPWHSVSAEVQWIHGPGWQVCMPSNAEDATGLLRGALRSNNPTIFFEHRYLLDAAVARRPYPGDDFLLPMGKARVVQTGSDLTIVTWGAMVERSVLASQRSDAECEVIDLRTLSPWDRESVLDSVNRTHRCLIVHEDNLTAGFGAEVAATVGKECFLKLDSPVERIATTDTPIPYNVGLMNAILPSVDTIADKIREMVEF